MWPSAVIWSGYGDHIAGFWNKWPICATILRIIFLVDASSKPILNFKKKTVDTRWNNMIFLGYDIYGFHLNSKKG